MNKVTVEFTDKDLTDVLLTGLEQGIGYWAMCEGVEGVDGDDRGYIITEKYESFDSPRWTINRQTILTGLQKAAKEYPHLLVAILSGQDDAFTADALIQLGALGELRYG